MSRLAVVAAVALGALLRAYPVQQPLVHPELQQALARHALLALARHDWRPAQLHHGSGFLYALRTFYTAWYACGRLSGAYRDRVDVLAAFAGDPFPFVVGARLLVLLYATVALALTAVIGTRLGGPPAGAAAALFLAVTFVDVRGAHHVWHDVPASALILATVTAALAALDRRTIAALVTTGALAGPAVATSTASSFPPRWRRCSRAITRSSAGFSRPASQPSAPMPCSPPTPSSASTTRSRRGAGAVERPGPNITIWEVPGRR